MTPQTIPLPVVHVQTLIPDKGEDWRCDVQFGPDPNDPWVTVTGRQLPRMPKPGDVLLVIPPQVTGYFEGDFLDPGPARG